MSGNAAMKILAIIAARGGSKGVKDKNIRILLGKPLIAYTIDQIIKWGKFEKFIVSTDSKRIADIAIRLGAEVPFTRPEELASDTAGKLDVLRHALREAERCYGIGFDAVLDLDATAPLRSVKDIENIVRIFTEKRPDCVFSVVEARRNPYFNVVEENKDGRAVICKQLPEEILRRQDAPEVFEMNASMYVYDRQFLLDRNNQLPYSRNALIYKMGEFSRFDVDSEIDLKIVEFLLKEGMVNEQLGDDRLAGEGGEPNGE